MGRLADWWNVGSEEDSQVTSWTHTPGILDSPHTHFQPPRKSYLQHMATI